MLAEAAAEPVPFFSNAPDTSRRRWSFGVAGAHARRATENFIAAGFRKAYGANLGEFMPELMVLRDGAELVAACGLRHAAAGPLFLEQYLDPPADELLCRLGEGPVARSRLIEVGNLSVSRPGYARHFVAWLTQHLHGAGMHWALFSAVPALRNNFLRLGIPMVILAAADPQRLPADKRRNWGSYYDQQPQVTAVHVATAFHTLENRACNP